MPRTPLAVSLLTVLSLCQSARTQDPIAAEVQRLQAALAVDDTDENFRQIRTGAMPELALAEQALAQQRALAALFRIERIRANIDGVTFARQRCPERAAQVADLDRAWQEAEGELAAAPEADAQRFAGIAHGGVRALAEISARQVRGLWIASRDYGHATTAGTGLIYLGGAWSLRDLVRWLQTLPLAAEGKAQPLPPLAPAIDTLAHELLLAYRPPASLLRHGDFVAAHAAIADARALDASGARHGALLRYVQAAFRASALLGRLPEMSRAEIERGLRSARQKLAEDGGEHGIARLLLDVAEVDLAAAGEGVAETARRIIGVGLPAYFAVLAAAADAPRPGAPVAPIATVTLVRWPYT